MARMLWNKLDDGSTCRRLSFRKILKEVLRNFLNTPPTTERPYILLRLGTQGDYLEFANSETIQM